MKTVIKMQFDPEIAKNIGVEEAIMYSNIEFWCEKNKANNKHLHGGCYWTYNSKTAFSKLFPFWTEDQIKRILKNLKNKKYIKSANYNKSKYDRTLWYSAIYVGVQTPPIDRAESPNGTGEDTQPIPDNNTNNKHVFSGPPKKGVPQHTNSSISKTLSKKEEKKFSHVGAIKKLMESNKRQERIVGLFFNYRTKEFNEKFATQKEFNTILRRNIREGKLLGDHLWEDDYYTDLFIFAGEMMAKYDGEKRPDENPEFIDNLATVYKFKGKFEQEYSGYEKILNINDQNNIKTT